MKANLIIIVITSFFISSCNNKTSSIQINESNLTTDNKAFELFQQKCYACHSVTTKSHDEIIAPPMVAVKRRYMKEYDSKEDFVKAVVNYAIDPKEENALMRGAVNKFNVMPKQAFNEDDLIKIATYIYDNEIESPKWFKEHFKQNH